jgi:hypothetical protein
MTALALGWSEVKTVGACDTRDTELAGHTSIYCQCGERDGYAPPQPTHAVLTCHALLVLLLLCAGVC